MKPLKKLPLGTKVLCFGKPCLLVSVNDCSAMLQPTEKLRRVVKPQTGRNAGKEKVFETWQKCFTVSPDSELEVMDAKNRCIKSECFGGGHCNCEGCIAERAA